ncbi:hypothetical protein [Bradyrhizobium sp. NP1]|uniref:hypothetical protein n=1 Tax=Bradyrhizobium sp. NP1 TaxID=3049772 RepID=UPI0025A68362|nr:hypothetical protein [Bradyrhizobium sp. NP1]WJR77472.1 hypothetical protein QOU61_32930 [Bradyrhizobium sp. NP1]
MKRTSDPGYQALRLSLIILAMLSLGALSGVAALQFSGGSGGATTPRWQEIAWPFPRDGWPAGRAFRCDGGDCAGAELYVRAKLGFCNCDTGVADDDEVDRVADIDLISAQFMPDKAGGAVRVAGLSGRSRAYHLTMGDGARHTAIGFALSHRCDLLVAVVQGAGEAAGLQRAALRFLETDETRHWTMASLQAH